MGKKEKSLIDWGLLRIPVAALSFVCDKESSHNGIFVSLLGVSNQHYSKAAFGPLAFSEKFRETKCGFGKLLLRFTQQIGVSVFKKDTLWVEAPSDVANGYYSAKLYFCSRRRAGLQIEIIGMKSIYMYCDPLFLLG